MSEPADSGAIAILESGQASEAAPARLGCGAQLKAAREQRGMSLADVAQRLKYAPRQVQALEEGHYEVLPGSTFQRGFVRSYARLVGLEANNLVLLLGQEAVESAGPTMAHLQQITPAPASMPVYSEHTKAWPWILAMLLAVVGIGGYTLYKWQPPAAARGLLSPSAQYPTRAPDVAEGALPAAGATGSAQAPVMPDTLASAATAASARPIPLPQPLVDVLTSREGASAVPPGKIKIRYSAESWVEVRQGNGTLAYSGLNGAGAEQWIDGQPPFDLVIGNARAVKIQYRGAGVDLEPYTQGTVAKVQLK